MSFETDAMMQLMDERETIRRQRDDLYDILRAACKTMRDIPETGGVEITHEAATWMRQIIAKYTGGAA